jgi:hypothetical protein
MILPSANARYILPLAPVVVVLFVAAAESMPVTWRGWFRGLSLGSGVVCAFLLSIGDYLLCDADRRLPALLKNHGYAPGHTWYFGRLAFAYYLHHEGYRNLRGGHGAPRAGEYLIDDDLPQGYPVRRYLEEEGWQLSPVDTLALYRFPVRTRGLHAGWYGESRLPFTVTPAQPLCRYLVYRLEAKHNPSRTEPASGG